MARLDQRAEEIPQRVTVVKLDVEGAEFRALHGATRTSYGSVGWLGQWCRE